MQSKHPSPLSATYTIDDWRGGYESLYDEYAYTIDDIDGEIPLDLRGTLFRNGPGLFDIGGQPIHHPFDGDGMVCAITFDQGKAHFRNRYVRTTGFLTEQEAGKILYRGVFGTQRPGGIAGNIFDLSLKNVANTGIIYWGDKLHALWEAGEPHQLDPASLETIQLDKLGGILQPGNEFSAHPRIDPASVATGQPRMVNFGVHPGLETTITIYEFNQQGIPVQRHAYRISGFAFIHDFVITPNYCIFFQNAIAYNPFPYVLGWRAAGQCLSVKPEAPTNIIVIPRDESGQVHVLPYHAGAVFIFHHANGFEQGDEICIDSVCYDSFAIIEPDQDFRQVDFERYPAGQLWRFTLNLRTKSVRHEVVEERSCEFPAIHPTHEGRSYRYVYLSAADQPGPNAPHQAILKRNIETGETQMWSAAPRGFVGEPIFVARSEQEDDGWILVLVYNAATDRSDVVILDSRDLTKGPLATLHLKNHVPYGLHGHFTQQVF